MQPPQREAEPRVEFQQVVLFPRRTSRPRRKERNRNQSLSHQTGEKKITGGSQCGQTLPTKKFQIQTDTVHVEGTARRTSGDACIKVFVDADASQHLTADLVHMEDIGDFAVYSRMVAWSHADTARARIARSPQRTAPNTRDTTRNTHHSSTHHHVCAVNTSSAYMRLVCNACAIAEQHVLSSMSCFLWQES